MHRMSGVKPATLKATAGIRFDYISVPEVQASQYFNPVVDSFTFNKPDGSTMMKINTSRMPASKFIFLQEQGFNWDVFSNKTLQVHWWYRYLSLFPCTLCVNIKPAG